MTLGRRCAAEVLGTFWLVFGGCGSAVLASHFGLFGMEGIGLLGVALAFGLALLTMVYAVGPISGAHLNPAVSLGAFVAGRMNGRELGSYVASQLAGAIAASFALWLVARGRPDFVVADGFAANGYGARSPGGYGLAACFLAEVVLTAFFVFVVLAVTDKGRPLAAAPLAIGLALTVAHLIGLPVTNASVNPARSTGPALFVGGWALMQLWLFWIAPLLGGAIAGVVHPLLSSEARPRESLRTVVRRLRLA
jgi:aquaporin Z